MTTNDSLKKIITAHQTDNTDLFVEGLREIIADKKQKGHSRIARELEEHLYNPPPSLFNRKMKRIAKPKFTEKVPVSQRDDLPLLRIKHPKLRIEDVVLSPPTLQRVNRVLKEQSHRDSLAQYNLLPIKRVLFYGVPGCGKTLTAHALASCLEWPLLYIKFDSLISSYLGETAKHLAQVFDFASTTPCVLLFDEFDAIGKSRTENSETGELKRVVNTFLQLMDEYEGDGIVVAATNHEQFIDHALWRRFDEVIHFELPEAAETERLLCELLSVVEINDFQPVEVCNNFQGLSHSDITKICAGAIKQMVLSDRTRLHKSDLDDARCAFIENRPVANHPSS